MARTFRRQRTAHPIAELNVTNLIDLGFTLLIIFMIATPLIKQEQSIPINLPYESTKAQPKSKDTKFVAISIDAQGHYAWKGAPVSFEELSRRLEELAKDPNPPVLDIRGDLTLQYQQIIRVIDEVKKHNLSKISLDTRTGK